LRFQLLHAVVVGVDLLDGLGLCRSSESESTGGNNQGRGGEPAGESGGFHCVLLGWRQPWWAWFTTSEQPAPSAPTLFLERVLTWAHKVWVTRALLASVKASVTAEPSDGAVGAAHEIGSGTGGFVVRAEVQPVVGPVEGQAQSAA